MTIEQATQIAKFAEKNPEAARAIFDQALTRTTDPETRAGLELAREYYCNPGVRAALEQHVAQLNGVDR